MSLLLPEPIRIISDLHLGHAACALNDVRQIRPLIEGAGTIIFNGDTAEIRARQFLQRSEKEQEKLTAMLEECGVRGVYLSGNHDPSVSTEHFLDLADHRLFVTHGDFLFRYISPWSKKLRRCRPKLNVILERADPVRLRRDFAYQMQFTRECCEALEIIELPPPKHVWDRFKFAFLEAWPPSRFLTIMAVWLSSSRRAAAALERYRPEASAMVFGHTHYPGVWRHRGRWIINTGGFLTLVRARVVEVEGSTLTVRRVEPKSGDFAPGRLERTIRL